MNTDTALVIDGTLAIVWRGAAVEDIPNAGDLEGELVSFDAGVAVAGMLWDGKSLSKPEPAPPTIDDYRRAIQSHVDSVAAERSYDSGITCSSYLGSTSPAWAAEAAAFVAWRDAVWTYAYTELAKVEGGTRQQPTVAQIIGELPPISWPE